MDNWKKEEMVLKKEKAPLQLIIIILETECLYPSLEIRDQFDMYGF